MVFCGMHYKKKHLEYSQIVYTFVEKNKRIL